MYVCTIWDHIGNRRFGSVKTVDVDGMLRLYKLLHRNRRLTLYVS